MKDGLISPEEVNAMPIMKMIIKNLLGDAEEPGEVCGGKDQKDLKAQGWLFLTSDLVKLFKLFDQ